MRSRCTPATGRCTRKMAWHSVAGTEKQGGISGGLCGGGVWALEGVAGAHHWHLKMRDTLTPSYPHSPAHPTQAISPAPSCPPGAHLLLSCSAAQSSWLATNSGACTCARAGRQYRTVHGSNRIHGSTRGAGRAGRTGKRDPPTWPSELRSSCCMRIATSEGSRS